MDTKVLIENAIRAEGYAQGFKDGYHSCVRQIIEAEKQSGTEANKDTADKPKE